MRMLIWHVDYFRSEITQRGRSEVFEEPKERLINVNEALIAFISVEKTDETSRDQVGRRGAEEILKVARQLKVNAVVLHSFAHLFTELAKAEAAIQVIGSIQKVLVEAGCLVKKTPFGWFNTLELRAKGHPLSRIARTVTA